MTTHDREKIIAAAKEVGFTPDIFMDWQIRRLERFYAIAHENGRQAELEKQIQEASNAKNKTN